MNGETKNVYGDRSTWTQVSNINNFYFYAGLGGNRDGDHLISSNRVELKVVDGAGNESKILTYTTRWCV